MITKHRNFIRNSGQILDYRQKTFKASNTESANLLYNVLQSRKLLIIGLFILSIFLFGCGSNTKLPKSGLSELQVEAYRIINDLLGSDNPYIRVNAIEIYTSTKQLNYMPNIQKMLHDRYVPVRFAAAVSIGELQYAPALRDINELLKQDRDPNVVIAASYAMSRLGYPEYLKVLRESISSNQNQVLKANSALLLGKSGDRSSIKLLYKLMEDQSSSDMVTYNAAEALANIGDPGITDTLWAMLLSVYADVRMIGVKAIGSLNSPESESMLLSILSSDPVVEIRLAAAEQLGKMNNKKGKDVVLEVFKQKLYMTQDAQARERILTLTALAIGEIGTKDLTKYLPDLMKSESPIVRLAAAKAVFRSSRFL